MLRLFPRGEVSVVWPAGCHHHVVNHWQAPKKTLERVRGAFTAFQIDTNQIRGSTRSDRRVVVTLRRWVVPNIGRQLILERCIHGVAE